MGKPVIIKDPVDGTTQYHMLGTGEMFRLPQGDDIYMKTNYCEHALQGNVVAVDLNSGNVYSYRHDKKVIPINSTITYSTSY